MPDTPKLNADGNVNITYTEQYSPGLGEALNVWFEVMNHIPDPQYDPSRIISWLDQVAHIRGYVRKYLRGQYVHRRKGNLVRQGISPRSMSRWYLNDYVSYIDHVDTLLARIARQEDPRDVELYKVFAPYCPGYRGTIRPSIVMTNNGHLTIIDRAMWPPFEGEIIGFSGKVSVPKTLTE